MSHRQFLVKDCGCSSTTRPQLSGISQGCTLSPYLFVMVMTVLLHDAVGMLSPPARAEYNKGALSDVVYADDMLLVGVASRHLEEYLAAVQRAGHRYGMDLHADKFQLVSSRGAVAISMPNGQIGSQFSAESHPVFSSRKLQQKKILMPMWIICLKQLLPVEE